MANPTDVIDRQLLAFNNRDIEGFVACYELEAKVVQPDGSFLASGRDQIRERYGELFDRSPELKAAVPKRIEVGAVVVDEELITGFNLPGSPTEVHSIVAYRIHDDLIENAYLLA
ncbi:MAG TPA: nuclear transport factor 2 family protein [Acidimicrobiales bacterium]|jgi:hypothetical protein